MFDLKQLRAEVFTYNHWEKDIPILNPGDWFGKARVLSIEGGYVPLRLVVEADGLSEAIDVLADHETYKREVVIPETDFGDYYSDVVASCAILPAGREPPKTAGLILTRSSFQNQADAR